MERVSWVQRITNEQVLERIGERRRLLEVIKKRKKNWIGHMLRRDCLLVNALEGLVCGRRRKGRRRYKLLDDIKQNGGYAEMKRAAEERGTWRATM